VATLLMVVVGFLSIIYLSLSNALLQLTSEPEMRGRVMSLWSIMLLGSTPFGGPIIGWIGEHFGPRLGLAAGGIAAVIAAAFVTILIKNDNKTAPILSHMATLHSSKTHK
jgi:MFS family permease